VPYVYETVTVSSMTSLTVLARCANTDPAMLKALNPELLRGSTPPGTYQLRVPPGKALDCLRQLAHMPAGKRLDFQTYLVKKGDTLAKVAKRFNLTADDLLAANDITAKQFRPGKRLLVPPPSAIPMEGRRPASEKERVKVLSDRPLAPLPATPHDLDVPADSPETIEVSPPAVPQVPAPMVHKEPVSPLATPSSTPEPPIQTPPASILHAKPGDTLAKLARSHQVPLGELMRLNPEAVKTLHPGDEVRLPSSSGVVKIAPVVSIHKVQTGETLASIARKYGVDPGDLKAWNNLKGGRVKVGPRLQLSPR
jgi:membrane-bound lytic murein transglycosylase D